MNNLFIMHTQYNLILANAIKNKEDRNILVLYSEFNLSDNLLKILENEFTKVIVVHDKYIKQSGHFIEIIKEVRTDIAKTKDIWNESYDNIFLSQDRIFDTILCARVATANTKIHDIEEDAYYSLDPQKNDISTYKKDNSLKMIVKRMCLSIVFWKNPYFNLYINAYYGFNDIYDDYYVLFPEYVREELKHKVIIEIQNEHLISSISKLYCNTSAIPTREKNFIFFLDLLERYAQPDAIKNDLLMYSTLAQKSGYSVYIKYHPREVQKIACDNVVEIDYRIPSERVLLDFVGKHTVVFGTASTALLVAKKLNFTVVSNVISQKPNDVYLIDKLKEMGLILLDDETELDVALR